MEKEKRVPRSYKIKGSVYDKATKRAARINMTLSGIIEQVVELYAKTGSTQLILHKKKDQPK